MKDNEGLLWLLVAMVVAVLLFQNYYREHTQPIEIHAIYCQGTRCEYV